MTTSTRALSFLTDSAQLSEFVGAEAVATRVRIKPGVSISAAFASADGTAAGWARLLWPEAIAKGHKSAAKAQCMGRATSSRTLDDGLWLQWGSIASDPDLMAHIGRAHDSGIVDPAKWQVLRHNPLRRLVARSGGAVVRIHAAADTRAHELHALLSSVVPVPERLDDGADPHMSVLADAGGFDLSSPEATADQVGAWHEEAGALFARLHCAEPPRDLASLLSAPAPSTRRTLALHARIIAHLDADLGKRIEALADCVPEPVDGPLVPIHADASPDQVLVGSNGSVLLTDFDRARMGSAALDVASYMASAQAGQAAHFLHGYEQAGGALPDERELLAARIHALALRLADPLREVRPDWAQRITHTLTLIEEDSACL